MFRGTAKNDEIAVFVKMKKIDCLTCKRLNRVPKFVNGVCLTCKQGNRKQEIVDISE